MIRVYHAARSCSVAAGLVLALVACSSSDSGDTSTPAEDLELRMPGPAKSLKFELGGESLVFDDELSKQDTKKNYGCSYTPSVAYVGYAGTHSSGLVARVDARPTAMEIDIPDWTVFTLKLSDPEKPYRRAKAELTADQLTMEQLGDRHFRYTTKEAIKLPDTTANGFVFEFQC